jgi:hypothetical protein
VAGAGWRGPCAEVESGWEGAMGYSMRVVEVESGVEYELPADAVTRDAAGALAPLIPLGFRAPGAVFFVSSRRWPELMDRPLRTARGAGGR